MKRILGVALLSVCFGQAAPPPAPQQAFSARRAPQKAVVVAEPTVVGVFHCMEADGKANCAVYEAGGLCRDISHWRVIVNSKEFATDGWSDALKEVLSKWPRTVAGESKASDLESGIVLITSEPTAPWTFAARVEAVVHDAGIHRICACESAKAVTRVDQVVVVVDFDHKQNADRRSYGKTDVTSRDSLVEAIRNAVKVARARGAEPLVRIRAHGACSWSTVARTEAECREAGAVAIDVAVNSD